MFRAVGVKKGKELVVEYNNGKVTFNGKEDYFLEKEFFALLETCPGLENYTPEDPRDPVNVYGALEVFFYPCPEIETDEEINVPYVSEEGGWQV